MSELKATLGPWVNVGGWVDAEKGGIICSLSAVDMKDEATSDANAHLIAAAPELYEALDMLMDASGPGDSAQLLAEERENIIGLLAKARGEQP